MDKPMRDAALGCLFWTAVIVTFILLLPVIGKWVVALPALIGIGFLLTFVPELLFGRDRRDGDE